MTELQLVKAVEAVHYRYYSKPMSVVNIRCVKLPIIPPLKHFKTPEGYEFYTRGGHGLLHVIPAMRLIDDIHAQYAKHVDGYLDAMSHVANFFNITQEALLYLIRNAVLFHDSGRQGDGADLWDDDSADICFSYLQKDCNLDGALAKLIADTIRYKDDSDRFMNEHRAIHPHVDFIRELVNMADTLEVIRCRDVFEPNYLPIAKHIKPFVMVNHIIPELVVPHRQRITDQGRLLKAGRINYPGFDDSGYRPKKNHDRIRMPATYLQICKDYHLSVLHIDNDNLDEVIQKALRGVRTYIAEHKKAGLQFFHQGFFSPRYHGATGILRANKCEKALQNGTIQDQLRALYDLLNSSEGPTLQETVLCSLHQMNKKLILSQLDALFSKAKQPH